MQTPDPPIPAPSGKYTGIPDYLNHAVHVAGGSGRSLAKVIGLTTGSRISHWRSGFGTPGVLSALRLAKFTGDDPADVLIMSGHGEIVDALREVWDTIREPEATHLAKLEAMVHMKHAVQLIEMGIEAAKK